MSIIVIDEVGRRVAEVQSMLTEIRPKAKEVRRTVPTHIVSRNGGRTLIVAAADQKTGDSHRDWLFRTRSRHIWAQYSEEWEINGAKGELKGLALHFYAIAGPSDVERHELCALHCEPNCVGEELAQQCKRTLHVHVTADRNRLAHAHFPIDIRGMRTPFPSLTDLMLGVTDTLRVLDREVLARLDEA